LYRKTKYIFYVPELFPKIVPFMILCGKYGGTREAGDNMAERCMLDK
jgi:hypothetical protein